MPSTLPGISASQAADMLQKTDKLIMTVPEVARVFGKTGKADTATDSAPLEMVETTIQLKPQDQWRPGMTMEKIIDELDKTVRLPGLANLWVPPIRNRIDMLSTGIKSPIGIKVSGTNLADIDAIAGQIEGVARSVPGVTSALAERLVGGRYLDIDIQREKAARYGMTVGDVQLFVSSAIGGAMVGETVEGVERYPINIRYPQSYRDSPQTLRQLPILTPLKQQIVSATRRGEGGQRAIDAEDRERPPHQLDLHRRPRPRHGVSGARSAAGHRQGGEAEAGHQRVIFRAV